MTGIWPDCDLLREKRKKKTVYNKKRLRPGVGPIGKCGLVVFTYRGKKVGHSRKKAVKRGSESI